jgi:hypothetical protein
VQQHIGNKVTTWLENVISPGYKVKGTVNMKGLTDNKHVSGTRQKLDSIKDGRPALPVNEMTHIIRQNRPSQISGAQVLNLKDGPELTRRVSSYSSTEMAYLTPVKDSSVPTSQQESEVQAEVNKRLIQKASSDDKPQSQPKVNIQVVADKIYRLMQHDLILERERATKVGG